MPVIHIAKTGVSGVIKDIRPEILPPEVITDISNFRFRDGTAQKVGGDSEVLGTPIVQPKFVKYFPPSNSPNWAYSNNSKMYAVSGTQHTEITRESGDYAGTDRNKWEGNILNGIGILNNGADIPQQWDPINPNTKLKNLTNFPTEFRCKALRPFKNFLMCLNVTKISTGAEAPFRIGWSAPANPGTVPPSWDTADPATQAGEVDIAETSDVIVDGLTLGDIFIIYKEASTWGARFIGGASVFSFGQILGSRGILGKNCIVPISGGHVVVTQNDMIFHAGQRNSDQSLINDRVRRHVFDNIDRDNFHNAFLTRNRDEVWFCYPEIGNVSSNRAMIWNIEDNNIGFRDIPPATSGDLGALQVEGNEVTEAWDSASGTWDSDSTAWDSLTLGAKSLDKMVIASPTNSKFYRTDGADNSSTVNTAKLERTALTVAGVDRQGAPTSNARVQKFIQYFYPLIEAPDGTTVQISVGKQDQISDSVTYNAAVNFVVGTDRRIPVFFATRYFAFKIESTGVGKWQFISYQLELQEHGEY